MNNIRFAQQILRFTTSSRDQVALKMELSTSWKVIWIGILAALLYSSCANQVAPTGGPRDETPPKLIEERSTANFVTNFKEEKIILTFDEWLQLKDVYKQVIISPPFETKDIYLRKKSVIVNLEDVVLKDSATYTINFGKAIQDLTEGNPVENYRFVFSTGPYIDSLEIEGSVTDALTNEPVEEILVMLYSETEDSVVYKDLPFYFATTDKQGKFKIQNVKNGNFKVFALKDADLNYLYNQDAELIGFLDTLVTMDDTITKKIDLRIFQPLPDFKRGRVVKDEYGHIRFSFTQLLLDSLTSFTYSPISKDLVSYIEYERDTLHFWYNDTTTRTFFIEKGDYLDTVMIKPPSKEKYLEKNPTVQLLNPRTPKVRQNPTKETLLMFNHPIVNIETDSILLLMDTLKREIPPALSFSTKSRRTLLLDNKLKEGTPYELMILPNALEDMFGFKNQDTIQVFYTVKLEKDYGNINITASGLDSSKHYVVILLDAKGRTIERFKTNNKKIFKMVLRSVEPGKFRLRVVEDTNQNGRWDAGSYPTTQPETVINSTTEGELRANWDLDLEIQLGEKPVLKKSEEGG